MPGLAKLTQQDFASGEISAIAPHLIPENGAAGLINLLLDEDGSPYRRGGSEYYSTSAFGASGLRTLWNGYLTPGQRILSADPSDFMALDAALAPVNLGGAGLSAPARANSIEGLVFVDGGAVYGGSRKSAAYSTGTVTTTNASRVVTGSGTTWNTLVDAGMLFRIGAERFYVVESVDSTTQITLRDAYEGTTGAGKSYSLSPISTATAPYRTSSIYAVASERLFSCEGSKAYFTDPANPHSFPTDNVHELPAAVTILGAAEFGEALFLFTSEGIWAISGLAFDLTDAYGNAQHRLEPVNRDLVLWGKEGIAAWLGGLIVPGIANVWRFSPDGPPEPLANSITDSYVDYVRAGYKPGLAAVLHSHYFLPILDSSNVWIDTLVCRLDRPSMTRVGVTYPWTRLAGDGAKMTAFSVLVGSDPRTPKLLGASRTTSRVENLPYLSPDGAHKNDANGTTPTWEITSRDNPTGDLNVNLVKKLRVRYELIDAAADNPAITAFYATDNREGGSAWGSSAWGSGTWTDPDEIGWAELDGEAPENSGADTYTWQIGKRTRYLRWRLRSSDPTAQGVLRSAELFVRPSGKA